MQARRHTTSRGFTLVELLIVIVVIAVLAAISVLAYNGISNRAKNIAIISAVKDWQKILSIYKINNSKYPDQASACLGAQASDFPASSTFSSGVCMIQGALSLSYSETYLGSYVRTGVAPITVPTGIVPEVVGDNGAVNTYARGILYEIGTPGVDGWLRYHLIGASADCGPGYRYLGTGGGNTTVCRLDLK